MFIFQSQFMIKTVLFICSANKQRSKTAEDYFSSKYADFYFISAGTNIKICEREGTTPLSIEILEESDLVFVMEQKHKKHIMNHLNGKLKKELIVLNIPDIYKYYQKELIDILEEKLKSHLLYWVKSQ